MMTIWSNFAKYGDPNFSEVIEWKQFAPNGSSMLLKGLSNFEVDPQWRVDAMRLWFDHLIPTYPSDPN